MGTPSAKTRQKKVVLWRSSPSVLRWLKIRWFISICQGTRRRNQSEEKKKKETSISFLVSRGQARAQILFSAKSAPVCVIQAHDEKYDTETRIEKLFFLSFLVLVSFLVSCLEHEGCFDRFRS
jgi:hypothetical protein